MSLRFSDRAVARYGAQPTLLAGTVAAALGLLLFVFAPVHGVYLVNVLPGMTLMGLGMGVAFPALMALAMSDVRPQDAGIASGLVGTTAEAGGALGLAVLATLADHRTTALIAGGAGRPEALTSGYHLAFVVGTALLLLAAVVTATVLKGTAAEPAEEAELEVAAA
jgi:MFS family permease